MKLRKGWIWYLAGLMLAVIAGTIAMVALRQAAPTVQAPPPATQPVVVAREHIDAQQVIVPDSLEVKNLLLSDVPSGAIFRVEDAAGKFALQPLEAGQPLLAQNLVALSPTGGGAITTTGKLAALLPSDKIAIVLPADDLLSQSGDISAGDRIDILTSLPVASSTQNKGGQVTLLTLQNVPVVKVLQESLVTTNVTGQQTTQPGKVLGLVIAVDPQDSVTLKYYLDAGARVSIGLRPPKFTNIFNIIPVTLNYLADKFGFKPPELLP